MRATVGAAWYCTKCTDCRVSTRQRNTQPVRTRSAVERAARAALLRGLAERLYSFARIRGERTPPGRSSLDGAPQVRDRLPRGGPHGRAPTPRVPPAHPDA